ncbi:hypothetical protein BsWGS_08874 [Bradybaena similaris]
MSSCCKSLFKASPHESSKQGQGRVKDTTTGQSKMALLLPVSCWQVIVQLLASDNEKLQKQLRYSQRDGKPSEREHFKITTRSRNIKLGGTHLNQPSCYDKIQGRQANRNDRQLVKLLSTIVSTCSPQRRTQALLTQAKSTRRQPSETRTRITDASSQTVNQHCDSKPVTISIGVSRNTQTDTQTENRAVNTNVYFKQRQTVQSPPATQRSAVNEHLKQESADQGKPVQQEPKRRVVKNTQEERHCFFCRSSKHEIKFCELYLQKKSQRRGGKAVKPAQNREVAKHNVWSKDKRTNDMVTKAITVTTNVVEQTKVSVPPPPPNESLQSKVSLLIPPLTVYGQTNVSLPPPPLNKGKENNLSLPPPPPNNGVQNKLSLPPPPPNNGVQNKLSLPPAPLNNGVQTNLSMPPPPPLSPPPLNVSIRPPPSKKVVQTMGATNTTIKTPETSMELAAIVRKKIDTLLETSKVEKSADIIDFCVYCRSNDHQLSSCYMWESDSTERQGIKKCTVCNVIHNDWICPWLQILDIVHSLTEFSQRDITIWCPAIKEAVDKPSAYIFKQFRWDVLKPHIYGMFANKELW